jgi:predicted Fe-Mo cluster-binding NifX family protein
MKIVVTASGSHLDAPISPVFGRCPLYMFVDTETLAFEAVENPAISSSAGAGIQAAQFVVGRGAQALLTGNIGPNAASALQAADVPVYQVFEGTVQQAVEMFQQGRLPLIGGANVPSHSGMRGGRGMGMGRGLGRGMGMGQGMGRGRGWGGSGQGIPSTPPGPPAPEAPTSRQEEVALLRQTADELRRQLSEVMERLEELEKE